MLDYDQILENAARQLSDVIVNLKQATALADSATDRANEDSAVAKKSREELLTASDAVKVREKAVEGKESAIITADALAAARDGIEAGRVALENDRKAFEKESVTKRGELDQQLSDVATERKALKEAQEALAVDKATYKDELLKDLQKTAAKK